MKIRIPLSKYVLTTEAKNKGGILELQQFGLWKSTMWLRSSAFTVLDPGAQWAPLSLRVTLRHHWLFNIRSSRLSSGAASDTYVQLAPLAFGVSELRRAFVFRGFCLESSRLIIHMPVMCKNILYVLKSKET